MAEEAKKDTTETPGASDPAPDNSSVEILAQKLGWKPDFNGDGAVDAETFILRSRDINSSLGKKVNSLTKELSAVKEGMEVVKWNAERSYKGEISRLKTEITALKSDRKKAIEEGNVAAVEQYDDKIKDLEKATEEEKPKANPKGPVPDYVAWVKDNRWYEEDAEMRSFADALRDTPECKALEAASFSRMLAKISKTVKKEFADKFPKKKETTDSAAVANSNAAPVTPSRQRAKPPKTKVTAADLSYEQRNVGKDFVAMGVFKSLDEYAQSLEEKSGGNS